jgi:hypothetical protein
MRVLVAGRNAKVLATAAGAFANDLQIHTAATKAACFALLKRSEFDLIVACETLGDGSGLEVLSHVAVNTPNTLRIFAARPSTLNLLKGELGLFGLFRTLPYPINFRKLWAAINLARSTCVEGQPANAGASAGEVKQVVLEYEWDPAQQAPARRGGPPAGRPSAQAATGSRQVAAGRAVAKARPVTTAAVAAAPRAGAPADAQRPPQQNTQRQITAAGRATARPTQTANAPPAPARRAGAATDAGHQVQQAPQNEQTSGMRAAARYAAAHAAPPARSVTPAPPARSVAPAPPARLVAAAPPLRVVATAPAASRSRQVAPPAQTPGAVAAPARQAPAPQRKVASARPPAPIPQTEAFKRALAKRNAAKLEANSHFGPTDPVQSTFQAGGANNSRGKRRREPGMTQDSLSHLAKLAASGRSTYNPRGTPVRKNRAALFVGSGVFAATTAAVLTFFMINANNSMARSKLPLMASVTRPAAHKVFPWQPEVQQPTRQAAFMRSESTASAAADLEVEAEAESENSEVEPGHPGPPQPNAPPPASEPPSEEAPAQWVDE